jgi:hypothetical protein
MRESISEASEPSKRKQGTVGNIRSPDISAEPRFAVAVRALWPHKTAAELAFRAKVSERAAKFWLSGDRDPSFDVLMVVLEEIRGRRRSAG